MNALKFAPDMSATAAREAIRLSGFSARKELDGFAIYAPRGRHMIAHESDPAAAVMVAQALLHDRESNRIALGATATAAGFAAVALKWCGIEFGFTGPDWEPSPATRFYAQLGEAFGMGATPAAARDAMESDRAARRAAARNAEIACESFLAAHAEPLPPALTVESAMAAETFAHGSDAALNGRASGIGPADMFATFYTAEGLPLATYSRPARIGDSGPFKGLFRLALTDGRVVAASRNVLTVQGVRRALADYAASTGDIFGRELDSAEGDESAETLAELARQNFRNAAANMESPFRADCVKRAARLARRAGCQIARMIARANARKAAAEAAEAAEIAPEADPLRPEMNWPAVTVTAEPGRLTAEGWQADAPAAVYTPQPCQQQQGRHMPAPDALGARQPRAWGVAAVPAELAAAFALAPVPRVDAAAVWQAIRDAREADAAALCH